MLDPESSFMVYSSPMKKIFIQIGELAKRSEISVETLRYYEKQGLLSVKKYTDAGYRLYDADDEQGLRFILHAKKVGFSLSEIKTLLAIRLNKDQHTCEDVKAYTKQKIAEIEEKITDLKAMRGALQQLHNVCCGGPEKASNCSILSSLENTTCALKTEKNPPMNK